MLWPGRNQYVSLLLFLFFFIRSKIWLSLFEEAWIYKIWVIAGGFYERWFWENLWLRLF